MKVTDLGASCCVIETPDVRVLCDPWFTDGIYDGSWFRFPPVAPFDEPVDVVWISHLHPDHYDPAFLKPYLAKHPARLLIADFDSPHLLGMMRRDGLSPEVFSSVTIGDTHLDVVVSDAQESENIDSLLVVRHGSESVLNLNDCGHTTSIGERIHDLCGRPSFALLPYSGAGSCPQAFRYNARARLAVAAGKYDFWLTQFADLRKVLDPEVAMPFAGQYLLGGKNAHLNALRGNPDATECLTDGVIVLELGATYDISTGTASGLRTAAYDPVAMEDYALSLADRPMAWESLDDPGDLSALVRSAIDHAGAPPCGLTLTTERQEFVIDGEGRVQLWLDSRYLFGLLTRKFHWNNAEVGSNLRWWREPDAYSWPFSLWLSRLHV